MIKVSLLFLYRVFHYIWVTYTYLIIFAIIYYTNMLLIATSVILWFFSFIILSFHELHYSFHFISNIRIIWFYHLLQFLIHYCVNWFVDTITAITLWSLNFMNNVSYYIIVSINLQELKPWFEVQFGGGKSTSNCMVIMAKSSRILQIHEWF